MKNSSKNLKNNKQLLSTVTLAEILKFILKRFKLQFFKIGDDVIYRKMTF